MFTAQTGRPWRLTRLAALGYFFPSNQEVFRLSCRPQESSLTATDQIQEVLESIRPAIQADGGDVELVAYDEDAGLVRVRLMGACESCPISMFTLKEGIERRLRDSVPGVREVEAI